MPENHDRRTRRHYNVEIFFTVCIICLQMAGACYLANYTHAGGDPIFTFTLANSPYEFNYIDNKLDKFPSDNGWFSADILKEQYVVMQYDRFNYSGVYWHQRLDNHPLLYYSLVHTICSLFPENYSIWYALVINLVSLLLIDVLMIQIAHYLFQEYYAGIILILMETMMVTFYGMVHIARMYMLLALMCLWLLKICLRIAKENQFSMIEILLCIFLGSQTHYYFYVYAFLTGGTTLLILFYRKQWKKIMQIFLVASMGEFISLIIFPWVVWHIIFNQMGKNETLSLWSMSQFRDYFVFVNKTIFNGRGIFWLCFGVVTAWMVIDCKRRNINRTVAGGKLTWLVIAPGTILYSLLIYTLNGAVSYYAMPVYLPASILMTSVLLTFVDNVRLLICYKIRRNPSKKRIDTMWIYPVVTVLLLFFLTDGLTCTGAYLSSISRNYENYRKLHAISENYAGADCLYVASTEDNLLQNLWFEFGNYSKFKRLRKNDYKTIMTNSGQDGWNSILIGKNSEKDVVIYLPKGMELPDGAKVLTEEGDFCVAVWNA